MSWRQCLVLASRQVGEPWSQAAIRAKETGLSAPPKEQIDAAAVNFFEELLSLKVIEFVDDIQRTLGSSGAFERNAVLEGAASQDEVWSPSCALSCFQCREGVRAHSARR